MRDGHTLILLGLHAAGISGVHQGYPRLITVKALRDQPTKSGLTLEKVVTVSA
jgi:hypothetical protein